MPEIKITFDEAIPKELEGKTFKEMFDMVRARQGEIIKRLEAEKENGDFALSADDSMYLRLAQMFKNLANGDMSDLKGISSPY